jgi:hypothetical protein
VRLRYPLRLPPCAVVDIPRPAGRRPRPIERVGESLRAEGHNERVLLAVAVAFEDHDPSLDLRARVHQGPGGLQSNEALSAVVLGSLPVEGIMKVRSPRLGKKLV